MKPATPLPFEVGCYYSGRTTDLIVKSRGDALTPEQCGEVVRRANAYPRLVAAMQRSAEDHTTLLRRLHGEYHMKSETAIYLLQKSTDEMNALLRELGELS